MFGKTIRKVGLESNKTNSAYYQLHQLLKQYTSTDMINKLELYEKDIFSRMFKECLVDGELSSDSIRYIKLMVGKK
tara:strand:- start:481 stop:708 length:228 start_codon:yes stop_codon:yes gene_type:complete